MTTYQYSKTVNLNQLHSELSASSITVALDSLTTFGGTITFVFKADLSEQEAVTLNTLVDSHSPLPEPQQSIPVTLEKVSPVSGRPEFIMVEPEGDSQSIPSHNFMDKTTWYQSSTRITGEAVSLSGLSFSLANTFAIDCYHGKITFENEMEATYGLVLKDNGVAMNEGIDFTMNYSTGTGTIDAGYSVTGPITCDYSYASSSEFIIAPAPGKAMKITEAEIQFTRDMTMKPVHFEIWAYNPNDLPNKVPVFAKIYKNIKDIIIIAREGKGVIPAVDVLQNDVLVFPFQYDRKILLNSSMGMELRVHTENDEPMGGEWGAITFYTVEEDE